MEAVVEVLSDVECWVVQGAGGPRFGLQDVWIADVVYHRLEVKDDEERLSQMIRRVDLAFGSGQYMCLGRGIAHVEINKAMVEVSDTTTCRCRSQSLD